MKFATRTAQDTTPEALAARLFALAPDDAAARARALELLRRANPETIDEALRGALGSLVLLPRGDDPPASPAVRGTATVAAPELERVRRALGAADRVLRDHRDARAARARDALAIVDTVGSGEPRDAARRIARVARDAEIQASLQYDGTVPARAQDGAPTLERIRQAMLAGFVDRDLFPFDATGLRYHESSPGRDELRAFGLIGDAGLSNEASLLLPAELQPAIAFDQGVRLRIFNQNLPDHALLELIRLRPEDVLAQFAAGLRFEPFRDPRVGRLAVRFSPPPVAPAPDDVPASPRDDHARERLEILRAELAALVEALDGRAP